MVWFPDDDSMSNNERIARAEAKAALSAYRAAEILWNEVSGYNDPDLADAATLELQAASHRVNYTLRHVHRFTRAVSLLLQQRKNKKG